MEEPASKQAETKQNLNHKRLFNYCVGVWPMGGIDFFIVAQQEQEHQRVRHQ